MTARFTDYTRKANRDLIERAFNGTDFLKNVPAPSRDLLASYPEQFVCSSGESRAETGRVESAANWSTAILITAVSFAVQSYFRREPSDFHGPRKRKSLTITQMGTGLFACDAFIHTGLQPGASMLR